MGLGWTEHLSVGNAMIDAEHRNLITAINSVEHALGIRDRAALLQAIDLLETYMRIHFKNEEKIAEAINFPFAQNRLEHQHFMDEMASLTQALRKMDGIWSDDLARRCHSFVNGWMTEHIMNEDMRLKAVLQTFPYDFKPE